MFCDSDKNMHEPLGECIKSKVSSDEIKVCIGACETPKEWVNWAWENLGSI